MKRWLALGLVTALVGRGWPSVAHAESDEEPDPESDEEPDPKEDPGDKAPSKKPDGKQDKKDEFIKQDLTGHDQSGTDKSNMFEKDRFFVDKVDDKKTSKGTLVQGSLTSTTFAYKEGGGQLAPATAATPAASQFSRIFTDLRLQSDFRHLGGGKWDARADVRARAVASPGASTANGQLTPQASSSQSGLLGENELDVRELWLIRSGKRSDVIFGRQFIADLAGVKIDGLRVDYASSEKLTFLGFAGLFPIRGSRSIDTDYTPLISNPDPDNNGARAAAGRFTGTGGFGAAYRTPTAYGSFGGVVQAPLQAESPRVFGVAQGYWRANPKVDFYHFLVLDLVGSNTDNAGLTNLSLGANFKPDQRLRATVALNRVDTETLNVQANAFLQDPDVSAAAGNIVQNEAFLARVAQNSARASISAGLGNLQRFEITVATALRYRGEIVLPALGMGGTDTTLPAGKSVEVFGGISDRRSFKKLRIGLDGSRIFKVGGDSYQRTSSNMFRAFVARELGDGHGEWEAEASYTKTKDDQVGTVCDGTSQLTCFGSASSTGLMLGGNVYYRFNRDWFGMTSLFLTRQSVSTMTGADPTITGLSGFLRAAYRF